MPSLETIIPYITDAFFSLSFLCTLFFFYKALRHHNKSYGLLMVLILVLPLFGCSVVELIVSILEPELEIFDTTNDILTKFACLWIICLAIFHYFIVKSFKTRYSDLPYKKFIACGSLVSLAIAYFTNIELLIKWSGDFILIYILAIVTLGYISIKTRKFREEIKFGLYSVAKEPASKLIKFSTIQALFAFVNLILDLFDLRMECIIDGERDNSSVSCAVSYILWIIVCQCWIWFAVLSNWEMFSLNKESEIEENPDLFSNFAMNSPRSSAFLPPNN